MVPNISRGERRLIKIVSLLEGSPLTGVNPSPFDRQPIYLDKPITTWTIEMDGEDTYWLSIMGYNYTGAYKDDVVATFHASENVKWLVAYYEPQDAYTIALADDKIKGWTVHDEEVGRVIKIGSLIHVGGSPPPSHLFRFEFASED